MRTLLFIAPISDDPNGQSIVSEAVKETLEKRYKIIFINLNKNSHKPGINSLTRIFDIIFILVKCTFYSFKADLFYLTISESTTGNIRDLFLYLILYRKLNKSYIHIHGGKLKINVLDKASFVKKVNLYFIKKLKTIIVLGESHRNLFDDECIKNKIKVIENFYNPDILLNPKDIQQKFENLKPLKFLYMSNFYEGKGYEYFLQAILLLESKYLDLIEVTFAGGFENDKEISNFQLQIASSKNIKYVGIAKGELKNNLFNQNHVLCFPSYIEEGQGISILEAYASGMVVITTGVAGIADIFQNNINGYEFLPKSAESLKSSMVQIIENKDSLYTMGINNFEIAKVKYSKSNFQNKISSIF